MVDRSKQFDRMETHDEKKYTLVDIVRKSWIYALLNNVLANMDPFILIRK